MIEPSQCSRILRVTFDEPDIKPAAEKRCGKLAAALVDDEVAGLQNFAPPCKALH